MGAFSIGSLWNRLFKRYASESTPFYIYGTAGVNNPKAPVLVDTNDLMSVYLSNPLLRLIIDQKAMMFKNADIKMIDRDGNEIENHWALDLLAQPNPLQSQEEWMAQLSVMVDIYGVAFVYALKAFSTSDPKALWVLPSGDMEIIKTGRMYEQTRKDEIIKEYRMRWGDMVKVYQPNDLLQINQTGSPDPINATSKIISQRMAISNIEASLRTRNILLTEKGAIGILSSEVKDGDGGIPLGEKERKRLEQEYRNKYGIGDDQMKIIMSTASVKWTPMSYPTKDLMLFEENEDDFNSLCGAFGMKRDIFPSVKGATFENSRQAETGTYTSTIQPFADSIMRSLTKSLGLDQEGLMLVADYSWLPVMQEDKGDGADVFKTNVDATARMVDANIITPQQAQEILTNMAGIIVNPNLVAKDPVIGKLSELSPLVANNMLQSLTINEIRAIVGLPPVDGGDTLLKPQQQAPANNG